MAAIPVRTGRASTLISTSAVRRRALHTVSFNTQGWFVGGGVENNLDIFGITAPGWFMKTEYRAAYYDNKQRQRTLSTARTRSRLRYHTSSPVQTVSTSLVYRFNWAGPVVAKY